MFQVARVIEDPHRDDVFLEQPAPLPEIDAWIEEYVESKRRFTFTERDVLQTHWDQGEDIRLREDSRFCEVSLPHQTQAGQWRLQRQTIANQRLYEALVDEEWNGNNVYQYLDYLDQNTAIDDFHIVYVHDPRFMLTHDDQGVYHVSLALDSKTLTLTSAQKHSIDQLAPQLLDLFPKHERMPWSTHVLLEHLKRLSSTSDILEAVLPLAVEHWLLQREEWMRVGRDSWFPKKLVPALAKRHRYAVLPVSSSEKGSPLALPQLYDEALAPPTMLQAADQTDRHQSQQATSSSVKWKVALRTIHINEGYIPIPTPARVCYPRAKKLASIVAIPGMWFTDASEITIWLETAKHQLYGSDLQDQLAFLGAGTILEILWTPSGITFTPIGINTSIAEEEIRLVDLTELAHLRSVTLESYRESLRAIMTPSSIGWSFPELYHELCSRQQHKPNTSTIRSILSSSPEFAFVRAQNQWRLNAAITPEIGARAVRKATLLAQDTSVDHNEASITTMIAKNRQRLAHLRSIYNIARST